MITGQTIREALKPFLFKKITPELIDKIGESVKQALDQDGKQTPEALALQDLKDKFKQGGGR